MEGIPEGNSGRGISEEEFWKGNSGSGIIEGELQKRKRNSRTGSAPFIGVNEGAPYCLNRPIFKGLNVKADLK